MKQRAMINIRGIVQGVGFRPFVYRLAHSYRLTGWVCNTSGSVEIDVEGDECALNQFIDSLRMQAPPRARIDNLEASFHPLIGYDAFLIHKSQAKENEYQLISPDIATCEDCKREIFSAGDRRYNYPFTNCTNCGPRFTIIKDIPYDRPKTTMNGFVMCPDCQSEYSDPLDRRFHAQPNACPVCGPQVWLVDKDGVRIEADDPLAKASELLRAGNILALKGLGGFHLACDATDEQAVRRLRRRKKRPSKPLAVMIGTIAKIKEHCYVSREEEDLLSSPVAPIVLLNWRKEKSGIAPLIAPQQHDLGVMLPYTPLHHLLLAKADIPLMMTSGNLSGEPLAKDNEEALVKLAAIADYFLLHDRDIHVRCDDSVCVVDRGTRVIRRARGYAPDPIVLPFQAGEILACGPELKNTVCLTKKEHAFISQHIGDMGSESALAHLKDTINHYESLFRITPQIIACDMHPEYVATKYARQLASKNNLPCISVQHHHAHIVSGMIDNELEGKVIGVAFDGTG
ncbi:MAG TPA: carbamoyltransferase HypF, partial [Candidatus Acetothermia bacterium]|nr:carbamoyltransferase HypF [Candidatus Acetothermia bacterium]